MRKKKWIAVCLLITIGIIAILFQRMWSGHSDIVAGEVVYTYNCAWLDWKHARPGKIKKFVDDFSHKFANTPLNETFKISYKQNGGFKLMSYSIYTYSISKEYEILKLTNDEIAKRKLMFQIFKDVSFLFENQQKEVFWGILKSSAFREGDLMGNLIGFHIACGEISREEIAELCEEMPVSISLQLKKEDKFQANDSFSPKYRIVLEDNAPTLPTQLTKYINLEGFENNIRPLEQTKKITFFQ